jgi:hypothetical protein
LDKLAGVHAKADAKRTGELPDLSQIIAVFVLPVVREGGVRGEGDKALAHPEEIYAMLRIPTQNRLQSEKVFPHQGAHLLCVA